MGRFPLARSSVHAITSSLLLMAAAACTTTTPRSSASSPLTQERARRFKPYNVTACRIFTGMTQNIGELVASPLTSDINVDLTVEGAETINPDVTDCRVQDVDQAAGGSCNAQVAATAVRKCLISCKAAIETSWLDSPRFNMTITRMSDGEIFGDCSGASARTTGSLADVDETPTPSTDAKPARSQAPKPQAPTPQGSTPQAPASQGSAPQAPTPQAPAIQAPKSQGSAPQAPTPQAPAVQAPKP